jgi:FtsZ-binding cell division protein ZapB
MERKSQTGIRHKRIISERAKGGDHTVLSAGISFVLAVCLMFPLAAFGASKAGDIEKTRTALEKWVETERIISKEKRDWQTAEQMLTERIKLVEREIESLREKIGEAEESIAEADKKRQELIAENEKLKEATASLGDTLVALEDDTKSLLRRLPNPVRDRVKPLSQRLPDKKNKKDKKISVSERFQNVIGILNEVDKFNGEVSAVSEVRELDDGRSIEVSVLYVGIGQGYYVSNDGKVAGSGTVTPEGWKWKPANESAEAISQAIAILKNEKPASFVQLPVEVN